MGPQNITFINDKSDIGSVVHMERLVGFLIWLLEGHRPQDGLACCFLKSSHPASGKELWIGTIGV